MYASMSPPSPAVCSQAVFQPCRKDGIEEGVRVSTGSGVGRAGAGSVSTAFGTGSCATCSPCRRAALGHLNGPCSGFGHRCKPGGGSRSFAFCRPARLRPGCSARPGRHRFRAPISVHGQALFPRRFPGRPKPAPSGAGRRPSAGVSRRRRSPGVRDNRMRRRRSPRPGSRPPPPDRIVAPFPSSPGSPDPPPLSWDRRVFGLGCPFSAGRSR